MGYYYNQNYSCLSSCPGGTLAQNSTSGGVCQACIYPCVQCAVTLTNCTSCSQINQTLYLSNGSCVANNSCSNASYPNITTLKCELCASECSSCTNNNNCMTCSTGFYLSNSSCLSTCPNGTLAQNISFGGSC
jgi:proprotein convertase subtilisin/kexin type 5